jgi:hypothetical protein
VCKITFCTHTAQFHNGYFVDLFVRKSNDVAVGMYNKLGYIVYREVGGMVVGVQQAGLHRVQRWVGWL